jgi:hypothetical protein
MIGEIKEWGGETIVSSGNQDLTVGQQSGCVTDTARVEIAGSAPGSCSWVIEFRTVGDAKLGKGTRESPGNQDVTIRQQRRGVTVAWAVEIASKGPARICHQRHCSWIWKSLTPGISWQSTRQTDQCQDQTHSMASIMASLSHTCAQVNSKFTDVLVSL